RSQEKALGQTTPQPSELLKLVSAFHAFGDHREPESTGKADHGGYDRGVLGIRSETSNEGLVDLERVQLEPFEVPQGGVPSAKVIDGKTDTQLPQCIQDVNGGGSSLHEDTLRDLQGQARALHPALEEESAHCVFEIRKSQLAGREIHRDREICSTRCGGAPMSELSASF